MTSSAVAMSAELSKVELARTLIGHSTHTKDGRQDFDCPWCIYSAAQDGDKTFLSKIPRTTVDQIVAVIDKLRQGGNLHKSQKVQEAQQHGLGKL